MIIFSDRFTDQGILIISGGQLRRFVLLGLVCSLGTGALGGEFGPLTGVVVSAQQPIAGAEVTLFNFDHEQEEPRAAGRTRTDAQGHFAFASAEVGFSSLRARANSLAPAFSFVRAGENAITLGRPVVMTVTVQARGTTRCRSPLARVPGELRQRRFPDLPPLLFDVRAGDSGERRVGQDPHAGTPRGDPVLWDHRTP